MSEEKRKIFERLNWERWGIEAIQLLTQMEKRREKVSDVSDQKVPRTKVRYGG